MGYSCSYELVNGLQPLRKLSRAIENGRNWFTNEKIYIRKFQKKVRVVEEVT